MLIAVKENKFIVLFLIIFGTLSIAVMPCTVVGRCCDPSFCLFVRPTALAENKYQLSLMDPRNGIVL